MAHGKSKNDWLYVSVLGSLIYNHIRGKDDKLVEPDVFNPHAKKNNRKLSNESAKEEAKMLFSSGKLKKGRRGK